MRRSLGSHSEAERGRMGQGELMIIILNERELSCSTESIMELNNDDELSHFLYRFSCMLSVGGMAEKKGGKKSWAWIEFHFSRAAASLFRSLFFLSSTQKFLKCFSYYVEKRWEGINSIWIWCIMQEFFESLFNPPDSTSPLCLLWLPFLNSELTVFSRK